MGKEIIVSKDEIQGFTYYIREGYKKPVIYCYFTVGGKRERFSTRTTDLKQASIVAHEKYQLATQGKDVRIRKFGKVDKEFLSYKKTRISEATYKNYSVILGYVDQFLGDTDIAKIDNKTMKELEQWRRDYYLNNPKKITQKYKRDGRVFKSGKKYNKQISNRTINLTIGLTISVMKYAFEQGCIGEVNIPRWKPLKEKKREQWFTENDFLVLYRYYEKHNLFYACIVGFAFYTGVRIMSEVNRLKWKDVHLDKKFVVIRNRKHKTKTVNTPIPLFPRTIHILKQMKKMNGDLVQPGNYVFVNTSNRQVKSIRKSFATAVKKCGLEEGLTPYSLRHGFATLLIEKYDIPLSFISKIMGHSDTQMLEKVYQHLRDDVVVDRVLREHERSKDAGKVQSLKKQWTVYLDDDEI